MATLKLALTSDLYYPVTSPDRLASLAQEMAGQQPDAAVLAGDLAEALPDFIKCLKLFREELKCPIWIIPGDHDCWARPPYDSRRLWQELLPQAVKDNGCQWLEGEAFIDRELAIAGSIAWYDYSAAPTAGIVSDLEFAQQKYLHNADALRVDWEWSDPEFAAMVTRRLLDSLDRLEEDDGVKKIVVVTHFPILDIQIIRHPGMSFAYAYAGNLTLGRKVLAYKKVSHIISGHAHADIEGEIPREGMSPVSYRVLPGDYDKPSWVMLSVDV